MQKALPLLNDGASIVLTGSTATCTATPAFGVYAASKAAIHSFARTWAIELAGRGIRVNTLVPGSTETPGLRRPGPRRGGRGADAAGHGLQGSRCGGSARPEEIANGALFLASDQSSFMTGSELVLDGGQDQV